MAKYSINGFYNQGGQLRFMVEILSELDKFIEPGIMEIVVPRIKPFDYSFKNIPIVRSGPCSKIFWVQCFFPIYTWRKSTIGINLFNSCPFIKPDIVAIHDVTQVILKKQKKTFKRKLSYIYGELNRRIATKYAKRILTVSETSKRDIAHYYSVSPNNISVLGNAWQHTLRIKENDKVLLNYPQLKEYQYFLSVGSLIPNKNINWIKEVADRNPQCIFAIVGGTSFVTNSKDTNTNLPNVCFLGRLSDADIKGLMRRCKALIHPATYEGFGIPPMETLAVGRPIIIANASCLPEIYGKSAHYIDPYKYDVDLDAILKEPVDSPDVVLNKYSWTKIAHLFYNTIIAVK